MATAADDDVRIAVYVACRDESASVDTFMMWARQADHVYVLDTGSSDDTVARFRAYPHVTVHEAVIEPWRFDTARNAALDLVPLRDVDLCVSAALDEEFSDDWDTALRDAFRRWRCTAPALCFALDRVLALDNSRECQRRAHTRLGWAWRYAAHEELYPVNEAASVTVALAEVAIAYHPDAAKAREHHTALYELTVREYPDAYPHVFWLIRGLIAERQWERAIHYALPYLERARTASPYERAQTCVYIAAYHRYTRPVVERYTEPDRTADDDDANVAFREAWLLRAAAEAPAWLEVWMELAYCYHQWYERTGEAHLVLQKRAAANRALFLRNRVGTDCGNGVYLCNPALHEHALIAQYTPE